ncbi:MAG TPA: glycosyltransferase family 2 protein [Firmicutes bacterium]|jgi:glycosyltransferase involved in cell wall biosynthesis|nr:glycosyltransferase family 2 protein [Bacillota bacterium]
MFVSAIVPAYNEEGWVGDTVAALRSLAEIDEVIVSDDGSQDRTSAEAQGAGAIVCRSNVNRGKSQALREGVFMARGDVFAFVDADLRETAAGIRKLIHAVQAGETDMAIAAFGSDRPAGLGLTKSLAYWGIRYFTGEKMHYPLSGQRVLRRDLWNRLSFSGEGFAAEVELTIECIRKGFRVKEIPVRMSHRLGGNDLRSFLHRGKQFVEILRLLGCRSAQLFHKVPK